MIFKLFLFSIFHLLALGQECGISYNQERPKTSVLKKTNLIGDWPWVVSIHFNGETMCTGFIIAPKFVLTAAHCYNQAMLMDVRRRYFSIHAGSIYANEGEVVKVKDIKTFDNNITDISSNEIAIFELERPLTFNANISSICLPHHYQEYPGDMAFLAGFRKILDEKDEHPYWLIHSISMEDVAISFQEYSHCKRASNTWNYTNTNYICGGAKMKGSAAVDSGAPLMVKEKTAINGSIRDRWFSVGIVVDGGFDPFDLKKKNDPAAWSHTLFTRVSYYCDWIEIVTNGDAKCINISIPGGSSNIKKNKRKKCVDQEKREGFCQSYKNHGICDNPKHKLYIRVRTICASTCDACYFSLQHKFLTTKPTSTTIPSTKPTTSAVSEVVQYSGGCYDQIKNCPTSKDNNLCTKRSWVRFQCPESCGLCTENGFPRPYPPNATCSDADKRITNCLRYKDSGLCDDPQNLEYGMARTNCAYTCGVC